MPADDADALAKNDTIEDTLDAFFSADGFGAACRLNKFEQEEMVSTLVRHIRDPDPKVSLPATKQFWTMTKDIAAANGRVTTARLTQERQNGQVTSRLTQSTNLLTRLANLNAAPRAVSGALIQRADSSAPSPGGSDAGAGAVASG